MRSAAIAVLISPVLVAACSQPAREAAVCGGANGIVASEAWVRAAPEGAPMSAAYLTLCNGAAAPDRLVGAAFDGAGAVELHVSSTNADGMTGMAALEDGLALPSGETVALAPGGSHIMLIGLDRAVAEGDAPTITLEFENAPPLVVTLDVRTPAEAAQHSGH